MAFAVLTAAPALAVPGSYSVTGSTGATYSLLTSHNLVSGVADDVVYTLTTTGSGNLKLPFALKLYNQTFSSIGISTNGNIQFGSSTNYSTAYSNECLPETQLTDAAVMPFWDDLFMDSNDLSHGFTEGVFWRLKGSAPHRKFTVAWQGHLFNDSGSLVLAEVTFKEGSQNFTSVYGTTNGASATIGVQSAGGASALSFTQFSCNPGTNVVSSGRKLAWKHSG